MNTNPYPQAALDLLAKRAQDKVAEAKTPVQYVSAWAEAYCPGVRFL